MTGPMSFKTTAPMSDGCAAASTMAIRPPRDVPIMPALRKSEHEHEIDDVLHLDRDGVVLPVGIMFREAAAAGIQGEDVARLRALAQCQRNLVKIPAVPRQAGQTHHGPRVRDSGGPVVPAIETQVHRGR